MNHLLHGLVCAFLLLSAPLPAVGVQDPAPHQDTLPQASTSGGEGFPIRLDGEELFRVKNPLGPFTAQERAAAAQARLERIAEDPFYSPDLFEIRSTPQEAQLFYREQMVGVVTELDAQVSRTPLESLLADRVQRIEGAIARHREQQLPTARLKAALSFALATGLMLLLLRVVERLHRRLAARAQEARPEGLAAKLNRRLGLPRDRLTGYHLRCLRLLRGFLLLVIVLAYLQAAFSVVPLTRGYARAMLDYLLAPLDTLWQGLLANVGDLFFILVMAAITFHVLRVLRWLARESQCSRINLPGVAPEWAIPLYKIARLVVIAVAAMMIYPYIPGSSSAAFKGISLFAGALFTLGASGMAGNFIGGIVLVFMGLYRMGDRVRLGEVAGEVVEMNLLMTRLRTPKNEIVSIPNSSILGGQLVNYSTRARQEGLILHTSVTIGYDTPWRQVHQLLLEAARRTQGLLTEPAPFVLQTQLADFYVAYELNACTRNPEDMPRLYSELHQNIQDEFNRAGVQIMSPHYEHDPEEPKLVPPERWEPPARPAAR